MRVPAELQPCADLWTAAIQSLLDDARKGASRGHKAGAVCVEALDDVLQAGPILRRLCKPVAVDPELVSRAVRQELFD